VPPGSLARRLGSTPTLVPHFGVDRACPHQVHTVPNVSQNRRHVSHTPFLSVLLIVFAVAGTARRTLLPSLPTTSFTSHQCVLHRPELPHTSHQSHIAFRLLHSSTSSASPELVFSSTSATSPITSIAKQGSNQLSLEQPRNDAGA
jgi:hypothetical protein